MQKWGFTIAKKLLCGISKMNVYHIERGLNKLSDGYLRNRRPVYAETGLRDLYVPPYNTRWVCR